MTDAFIQKEFYGAVFLMSTLSSRVLLLGLILGGDRRSGKDKVALHEKSQEMELWGVIVLSASSCLVFSHLVVTSYPHEYPNASRLSLRTIQADLCVRYSWVKVRYVRYGCSVNIH